MDDSIKYENDTDTDISAAAKRTDEEIDDAGEEKAEAKIKKVKDELKKCEVLQKEYLDGWQRARADFMNYKKDEGKRYQDIVRVITEDLMRDIILVLDSFEMARRYDMPQKVADGVFMIQAQLEDVLRKRGLEVIPVNPGDALNPAQHESIGERESEHPSGSIAEEVQKGYAMNGRVVRPARVKLAK